MMHSETQLVKQSPLSMRFSRLAKLATAEVDALEAATRDSRRLPARRELIAEGEPIRQPRALLSGWACQQRILADGQRQILSFLLPGDLIGWCGHRSPLAPTTILAITEVTTCPVPVPAPDSALAEAYARSVALDWHYLLAQVTRLGRLSAHERLADWFLETRDRLGFVGLSTADQYAMPLTQEMLADALGLTSVHVNRTLQTLRREGLINLQGGTIAFPDPARMEKLVDYRPARVSADD